jgi:brefeldin A-inhibited guanine nucleotide-exchange protein
MCAFLHLLQNPALLNSTNRSVSVDFMSSSNKKAQQEEHHIRTLGLECMTSMVKSLEVSAGLSSVAAEAARKASEVGEHSNSNVAALDVEDEAALSQSTSPSSSIAPFSHAVSSVGSSGEKANIAIVDAFDKKQKFNEELETGILKFNLNPKAGLSYLAKAGHIEMTPKSVADFFHQYQDRLDKTAMGDYLGREREYQDGFCLKVLSEYVDCLDFTDMPFDLAIRCVAG